MSQVSVRRRGSPSRNFTSGKKTFFENGAAAFESTRSRTAVWRRTRSDQKVAALEEKLTRKNEVLSELMEEHVQLKKKILGNSDAGRWVPPDVRDAVVDFVRRRLGRQGRIARQAAARLGRPGRGQVPRLDRPWYGKAHEPNGQVPRDHW